MAIKTISVKLEAYKRLRAARRFSEESFSDVILRATWPEDTITAGELLRLYERKGPFFTEAELGAMKRAKEADLPPEDKWKTR